MKERSSSKPIIIAFSISLLTVVAVILGVYNLLKPPALAPELVHPAGTAVENSGQPSPREESSRPPIPDAPKASKKERLTVRVIEAGDGGLIAGARILIQKSLDGDRGGEIVQRGSQSANNPFATEMAPGAYLVRAQATGHTSQWRKVTIITGREEALEIALGRGLSISGRIYEQKTRRPIGGARVMAMRELGRPDADPIELLLGIIEIEKMTREAPVETRSGPDGFYQLDGLDETHYNVTALADGFSPRSRGYIHPPAENIDIYLPEGGIFLGKVIDEASAPVPGATIGVFPYLDSKDLFEVVMSKSRPPLERVQTDSAGNFEIKTLGSGTYNFYITAAGFQPGKFLKVQIREGKNSPQTYTLQPGHIIAGIVVNNQGQPLPGARVTVRPIQTGDRRNETIFISFDDGSVSTGADGSFRFNTLESCKHSLVASHDDYGAVQLHDVELGNTSLRITLTQGGAISGRITDAETGAPLPGARVVVSDLLDLKKTGVADAAGAYYIGGISAADRGKRFANIQAEGYARLSNLALVVEEGRLTQDQNFQLQRNASVSGRVVNSIGEPVLRARVMAKRKAANAQVAVTVGSAVSDQTGQYEISSLESGSDTWLEVQSSEYLPAESTLFSIAPGEHLPAGDIVLTLGGSIDGLVVDADGRGIQGAQVSIREPGETAFSLTKFSMSDARGRFVLKGLKAGVLDLQASSSHYLDGQVIGVEVAEGKINRDVKIVLSQGERIAGVVLDENDAPVRGATVVGREAVQGLKEYRQETDSQGHFSIDSFTSKEPVEIEVHHPDFSPYVNSSVAVRTENLEIRLERHGAVRGVVVDEDGNPVPSFSLSPQLQIPAGGSSSIAASRLQQKNFNDPQGLFEYHGIPAGTYTFHVRAIGYSGFSFLDITVQNGQVLDIGRAVLPKGGVINGFIVDGTTGQPIPGATVAVIGGASRFLPGAQGEAQRSISGSVTSDARGFFHFEKLQPGAVTLNVTHPSYVTRRLSDINTEDPATSRNLQVALEKGGSIAGVVVDVGGQPRPGMSVYLTGAGELANTGAANSNQRTETDARGRFAFGGLNEGRFRVTAHQFGRANNPSVEFQLPTGGHQEVELVVE